jgi:hypothetical protein
VVVVVATAGETAGSAVGGWVWSTACISWFWVAMSCSIWGFVVGVVGVAVAGLTIALIVPCVHHLKDFWQERYKFSRIDTPTICCDFLLIFI